MLFYFLKFNRLTLFSKRWKTCHLDSVSSVSMMQQEYTKRERDGIFLICFYPLNFCNSFQPIWETSFNRCFDYRKAIYDVINQSEILNQDFVTYNNTKKILVTSNIAIKISIFLFVPNISKFWRDYSGELEAGISRFEDDRASRGEGTRGKLQVTRSLAGIYIHIYEGRRVVYFLSGERDIPQGHGTLCSYANFLFPRSPCNAAFQSRGWMRARTS